MTGLHSEDLEEYVGRLMASQGSLALSGWYPQLGIPYL